MCIANKFPADADAAVPGKLGHPSVPFNKI
jgi:hypothetical protein